MPQRALIYSRDGFGLRHLRRSRAIVHALVEDRPEMSFLILSSSPIIGSFNFQSRGEFRCIPGVIKLRNGDYISHSLHIHVENTLARRWSIIRHTAETFDPDLFVVDKEPLGLRGEVCETLEMLKARGVLLVLGLRDVMDYPLLLAQEWERKNAVPALRDLYDEIWVYGLPQACNPLEKFDLPQSVHHKTIYAGYLRREADSKARAATHEAPINGLYLLVTAGGGGDGETLMAPLGEGRMRYLRQRKTDGLPGLLNTADLYVWPAVRETYGMALLEAQAAGVLVVAGDAGGVAENIRHGITGVLTPEGNVAELADAIAGLLADPARRAAMCTAAQTKIANEHSLEAASHALNDIVTTTRRRRAA